MTVNKQTWPRNFLYSQTQGSVQTARMNQPSVNRLQQGFLTESHSVTLP